jgi:DNA-binding Xre family transcriptional regulator
MRWILREYLEANNLTGYALRKATGLSSNTIYPLVNGTAKATSLATLQKVIAGLRQLTGNAVSVCDLLDYQEEA